LRAHAGIAPICLSVQFQRKALPTKSTGSGIYLKIPPDPDAADGATLFAQLHRALSNSVVYVDDGWNQLVSAIAARAEAGGCLLGVSRRVAAIRPGQIWRVETADGNSVSAPAVVIALPPRDASELLPHAQALRVAAERSVAVYAACLDLGLSQLPEPRHNFALGLMNRSIFLYTVKPPGWRLRAVLWCIFCDTCRRAISSTKRYYLLNSKASLIWSSLDGAHTFAPVNFSGRCRLRIQSRRPDLAVLPGGRAWRYQDCPAFTSLVIG
jgi:Flavin containing amine oxidoreductase